MPPGGRIDSSAKPSVPPLSSAATFSGKSAPQMPGPHLAAPPMSSPAGGPYYDGPPVAPPGQWQQSDPGLRMDSTDPIGWPAPPEWSDARGWTGMPGGAQR